MEVANIQNHKNCFAITNSLSKTWITASPSWFNPCLLRRASAIAHHHTPKMVLRSVIFSTPKSCSIRGWHFALEGRSQIHKKSASIKLRPPPPPPISATKNFMTPHHRSTLPPKQAKIVLKSVFLNKINTLSVVILWLPSLWSSKILWPPIFFFPKFMTPQYIWDPLPKKMPAPLYTIRYRVHSYSTS